MELLSQDYIFSFGFRWLHILVGIAWIGLLYYFNLVQVPGLAAYGDEGKARNITIDKIARRALWWFRWAAIATLATGILITGQPDYWKNFMNGGAAGNGHDAAISLGMLLGTLMAAWQDGAISDIKTALRDTAEKVDVIVARNQLD